MKTRKCVLVGTAEDLLIFNRRHPLSIKEYRYAMKNSAIHYLYEYRLLTLSALEELFYVPTQNKHYDHYFFADIDE